MAGYTRQDTNNDIANGNVIDADIFDAEYNAVEAGFNASTGHKHDGSAGEGAPITKVGPSQDIIVTSSVLVPKTSSVMDLGSLTVQFKDAFFDGTVKTDNLVVDESSTFVGNVTLSNDLSVGGNLSVTGNAVISGNLTFGDAATDTITFSADVNSHIKPEINNAFDLGSATQQWRNAYIDGVANIDSLVADTADINAGSIDNTVIGGNTAAAITGTTIAATSGFSGALTGSVTGNTSGTHTGAVVGNVTGNVTGNAGTATKLATPRTISINGDATGSVSFDGSANATLTATVVNDSHSHTISTVTGLQTALNAKADDTTTVSAGAGLTGGGTLGSNISISHSDTSTQASVTNAAPNFIRSIGVDTYGHITSIESAAPRNASISLTTGVGLDGGLSFTLDQEGAASGSITLDLNELPTSTVNGNADYFVAVDTLGVSRKVTKGNINLSGFNNDLGFGSGTIDGVVAGTGLSGGGITGSVTLNLSHLGIQDLADPGADRILMWDDSLGVVKWMSVGSNMAISGNTVSSSYVDTNTLPNNATVTIVAGAALTGGGNFTTDQSFAESITINHGDTSSQANVNNSGNTFIQDLVFDAYGHVTGVTSATAGINNATITIAAGTGLSVGGNFTTNQSTNETITLNLKLSELSYSTANTVGDHFAVVDSLGAQYLLAKGNINLSEFNNNAGWTSNIGDITGVTAGAGLTGGGTTGGVTLSHANTSSVANVNNSSNTFIQDLTFDTYGHVTAVASGTVSIGNATITIAAGGGLTGGAAFTANQSANETITVSHANTSSQGSVNNSGSKYIQDITLDTYGHITNIVSTTAPTITHTSGSAPYYGCRAWGYVSTGNPVAVDGSGNVASVVRNSTGKYTITFAVAMPNDNYAINIGPNSQGTGQFYEYGMTSALTAKSASSFQIQFRRSTNHDAFDCTNWSFSVIG